MRIIENLTKLLSTLQHPGFFRAFFTWRKFSLASFLIISRLIKSEIRPRTILDLGANIGQFAVAASHLFADAKIISFEPDPGVVEVLSRNVKGLPVEVRNLAIGRAPGLATFYVNADSQVSSLLPLGGARMRDFPESVVQREINVPVESLDSLFLKQKLTQPILLKIDVQGFEGEVISGAKKFLKTVSWIVMEVSFTDLYEGESDFVSLANLLGECGFKFVRPLNMHFSPKTGEAIEMDALFFNSDAHISL